jgi:putative Mn2+ efflux pump MntP
MNSFLLPAVFLSLDSAVVAFALSPIIAPGARQKRWVALFGICDGLAVVAGAFWGGGWTSFSHLAAPLFAVCCGVYFLVAANWNKFRTGARLAAALPILMSLDNLAYGMTLDHSAGKLISGALICGMASAVFAMAGFGLGHALRQEGLRKAERIAGLALIAAGGVLFLT